MEELQTQYRDGFCQICGEVACSLDFDEALHTVLESVHSCVEADASCVLLLDPSHKTLSIAAVRGLSQGYQDRSPIQVESDPVSAEVLRDMVLALEDMEGHPAYKELAESEGLRSALATPLKFKDRPMGALWVFSKEPKKFTADETSYLKTLSAQAGVALSNARLHQNLQLLSEVGRAVTSRLDEEQILNLIVENGTGLFHGKGASIFLLNAQKGSLELEAAYGLGKSFFEKATVPLDDAVKDCLEGIVVVPDVSKEEGPAFPEKPDSEGIHAVICAPLRVRGKAFGVLRLYMDHIRELIREEKMFLNILADFGAIAIQNARLFNHVKRDYEDLSRDVWDWYDWGERPPRI